MKDNTPGKHSSDSPTHGTGAGHELSELRIGPVVWFLVALTIGTVITFLLMFGLFDVFQNRATEAEGKTSPLAGERQKLPPEPRLQLAPTNIDQIEGRQSPNLKEDHPLQEIKRIRREEEGKLNDYGWVDEKNGIVRIPIEEAKKQLLKRGLPTRK
jgi:hypothetical protein